MNRNIITAGDIQRASASRQLMAGGEEGVQPEQPVSTDKQPDNYLGRLVKYIPPDVIATFIFLEGAVGSSADPHRMQFSWAVFFIILLATPFYLRKVAGIDTFRQILLSTIAFVVWAIAYQGPPFSFLQVPSLYTTVVLGLYTFLLPLLAA